LLPENMRAAAGRGFINATDCADYLVKKGLPFRDAYTIVGRLVSRCIERGCTLEELDISEYKAQSPVFDNEVFEAIKLETCVALRNVAGGPAPERVLSQMAYVEEFLAKRS
ncbi:MAG: argininosuccinate lyase, partial [Oscillospiraceae bacterium]